MNKKTIYISGMTCVSCETIIKDEINDIRGVDEVIVCHKRRIAEISYRGNEPQFDDIVGKIRKLGYGASLNKEKLAETKPVHKRATPADWVLSLAIVFSLYWLYGVLNKAGLLSWIDINPDNINYGVAILVGLVASVSTCLAVVGAVIISFSAKYQTRGNFYQSNIKPHLFFHIGRLSAFFLLGGLLGLIGSWFNLTGGFMGWFTILIGLVLVWLGLNILGFLPSLSTIGIRMPKKTLNIWNRLKESKHDLAPIVLGALTFFLPCGFTQSMQLFAISSGSFLVGGLTMFLFALGTVPVLGGLGIATTRFKNMKTIIFEKVIGFLVILFALYTLLTGFTLSGVNISVPSTNTANDTTTIINNLQTVKMTVNYSGFTPSTFRVKAGTPVKWVINGEKLSGCTNEIIVPSLNISKKLVPGENIVEFTPKDPGTINFSCWMGMVRGKFIVE